MFLMNSSSMKHLAKDLLTSILDRIEDRNYFETSFYQKENCSSINLYYLFIYFISILSFFIHNSKYWFLYFHRYLNFLLQEYFDHFSAEIQAYTIDSRTQSPYFEYVLHNSTICWLHRLSNFAQIQLYSISISHIVHKDIVLHFSMNCIPIWLFNQNNHNFMLRTILPLLPHMWRNYFVMCCDECTNSCFRFRLRIGLGSMLECAFESSLEINYYSTFRLYSFYLFMHFLKFQLRLMLLNLSLLFSFS